MPVSKDGRHRWTSAEDILEWRQKSVVKTIECWVPCPFSAIPEDGKGSTPMMLELVEIICDPKI